MSAVAAVALLALWAAPTLPAGNGALRTASGDPIDPRAFGPGDEERRLEFSDGSTIALGESAHGEVVVNTGRRVVFLLHAGRVDLDIVPGGPRAWSVEAGAARVEVVGTSFRVERESEHVRVAVSRGHVMVLGPNLPGGRASLTAGDRVEVPRVVASDSPAPGPSLEDAARPVTVSDASASTEMRATSAAMDLAPDSCPPPRVVRVRVPERPDPVVEALPQTDPLTEAEEVAPPAELDATVEPDATMELDTVSAAEGVASVARDEAATAEEEASARSMNEAVPAERELAVSAGLLARRHLEHGPWLVGGEATVRWGFLEVGAVGAGGRAGAPVGHVAFGLVGGLVRLRPFTATFGDFELGPALRGELGVTFFRGSSTDPLLVGQNSQALYASGAVELFAAYRWDRLALELGGALGGAGGLVALSSADDGAPTLGSTRGLFVDLRLALRVDLD